MTRYYYETGQFIGLHIMIYQPYEHIEDAEAYLDTYVEGLVDQGYLPMDPKRFNCYRTFLYFNEELRKYVAFDLNPNGDGSATLFYEIVSFEAEPDEESIMMKTIRR